MQYREQELQYDSENDELTAEFTRQQAAGKQYCRKRSAVATRRRSSKAPGSRPGCGIGARRNRRWTW